MDKRYGALRVISTIYKIMAGFIFAGAVLTAIGSAVLLRSVPSIQYSSGVYSTVPANPSIITLAIAFVGPLLIGGLFAVSLYAFANLIDLLIATEENTRYTAMLLNHLVKRSGAGSARSTLE
jgi:hypothetical protein